MKKNSIGNARSPQPREIVFNTMRYRNKTVQRSGDFQSKKCQLSKTDNSIVSINQQTKNYEAVKFINLNTAVNGNNTF